MSASARTCLRCGCGVSDARLEGLCPACLLQAGLGAEQPSGQPRSAALPHIDGYELIEQIGVGGMGVVYKARQHEPIKRLVAIKLIKLGMDTQELIARFDGERQALAQLNHPNVAAVYHADATAAGRPFFVMEHVPGEPITAFCDRHRYSTRQRLELFVQACEGIQHAHQKAIIHRDIKPSNLLVMLDGAKPLVKVIDFGVAKATAQRLTEQTMFTAHGQLIGTPEYMSPEQAQNNAADVDTRSDIYSLGVVLYELLSGGLPFDPHTLRSAAFAEIQRIIREVDPPRPSTRLSSAATAGEIAARHQTHAAVLARELRRELEWIPLKAIRKDRAHRYAGASELAKDVENYLAGRPLIAGPESARYRAKKFARRNKGRVVVAALIGVLILASVGVSTWQAMRLRAAQQRTLAEKREADRKRQQAEAAEAATAEVNRFLNDMLRSVQPNNAQGRQVLVLDVVNAASSNLDRRFATQPEVERQLRATVAQTLVTLGRTNLALPHLEREVALAERLYGSGSSETFGAMKAVSDALYLLGRLPESEQMLRELIARAPQVPGRGAREIMHLKADLAMRLSVLGRNAEADQVYRETLDEHVRTLGASNPQTLHTLAAYGSFLVGRREEIRGEAMLREALAKQRDVLGARHTQTLWTADAHASALIKLTRDAEAETLLRDTITRAREVLVERDSLTTRPLKRLSSLLTSRGRYAEAEQLLREHHEALVAQFGTDDPPAVAAAKELARVKGWAARPRAAALLDADRFAEAEAPLLEYRGTLLANGQNTYPEMRWALESLARVYDNTARPDRAARARDELAAFKPAKQPTTTAAFPATLPAAGTWSAEFVDAANWEAYRLRVARRPADSAALRRRVIAEAKRLMPPGHPLLLKYQNALADVLVEATLLDEAEAQLLDAYEDLRAADADNAMLHSQIDRLVKLYVRMGNPAAAAAWKSKLPAAQPAVTTSTEPTTRPH